MTLVRPLLLVYLSALAVLGGAFVLTESLGIPFVTLTRDAAIAHTKEAPFYGGYLSSVGVVLWATAAAVCLFVAATPAQVEDAARRETRLLLATFGLLTAILLVDDLFMVHEALLQFTGRGQKAVLLLQGALTLWMLWRFRDAIVDTNWLLLATAMGLFACSLVVDLDVVTLPQRLHHVLEDGFKLMGIAGWCGYAVSTSYAFTRRPSPSPVPATSA
jgi:hypothetical protein